MAGYQNQWLGARGGGQRGPRPSWWTFFAPWREQAPWRTAWVAASEEAGGIPLRGSLRCIAAGSGGGIHYNSYEEMRAIAREGDPDVQRPVAGNIEQWARYMEGTNAGPRVNDKPRTASSTTAPNRYSLEDKIHSDSASLLWADSWHPRRHWP